LPFTLKPIPINVQILTEKNLMDNLCWPFRKEDPKIYYPEKIALA